MIYSYLEVLELLNLVSKLSSTERSLIGSSKLINQPKALGVRVDAETAAGAANQYEQVAYAFTIIQSCNIEVVPENQDEYGNSQAPVDKFLSFLLQCASEHSVPVKLSCESKRILRLFEHWQIEKQSAHSVGEAPPSGKLPLNLDCVKELESEIEHQG